MESVIGAEKLATRLLFSFSSGPETNPAACTLGRRLPAKVSEAVVATLVLLSEFSKRVTAAALVDVMFCQLTCGTTPALSPAASANEPSPKLTPIEAPRREFVIVIVAVVAMRAAQANRKPTRRNIAIEVT